MDDKKSMIFYSSWYDIIQECVSNDKDKLFIIDSLLRYGLRNESVETDNPLYKMFQKQAFAQIDSAQDKHEKRVEAGRAGGYAGKGVSRNKGNKNAKNNSKSIANNSKSIANENENVNDNDNDNENSIHTSLLPSATEVIYGGYE